MKQWISLLLALVLSLALALPAGAAPPEQEEAAPAVFSWSDAVCPRISSSVSTGTDSGIGGCPAYNLYHHFYSFLIFTSEKSN